MRCNQWAHALVLVACTVVTQAVASPDVARAQTMDPALEQVDATPKGTVGLGIIGAEVGFAVPALAGLHDAWAFVVFPIVGAAGGALAGFYGIDNKDHSEAAVGVLATSLALVVPTMVLTLSMTAYDPEDEVEDAPPPGTPPEGGEDSTARGASPARAEGSASDRARARRLARAGSGLFRVTDRALHIGVPGIQVRGAYTFEQMQQFGLEQQSELHVALLSGVF